MIKKICQWLSMSFLLMPMLLWADSALCAGQSNQALMSACATSEDACITLIKYNCLSNNDKPAALQLAQITDALAQQYAAEVLTSAGQTKAQAPAPTRAVATVLPEQKHSVQILTPPSTAQNKSNYWF
jgi:hypothetical protein